MAGWAGTDSFDSYSDGNLTGNNGGAGWTAGYAGISTAWKIGSAVTFNSSAHSVLVPQGTNDNTGISRLLSVGVDSGDFYFATQMSSVIVNDSVAAELDFRATTTLGGGIEIVNVSGTSFTIRAYDVSGVTNIQTGLSFDTWYIVNVNFLGSTTFRARAKVSGGSFGAFTGTLTYDNSVSSPDTIRFRQNNGSGAGNMYYDAFGTSDPDSGGGDGFRALKGVGS